MTRTQYDLSIKARANNLLQNINRMIRLGGKEAQLRHILSQMQHATDLNDIGKKIKDKLVAALVTKPMPIQPAPITIKLPIPQWQKSGENGFQKMYIRLLHDAKQYHGDMDLMVTYSAFVLNMFMHMATVTPENHHACSQSREFDNKTCLQYGRSQGNHPNAQLYRKLNAYGRDNRLPANSALYKLISDIDPKGFQVIKMFDKNTGNPKAGVKPNGFANLAFAYLGIRPTNLAILSSGLTQAGTQNDAFSLATMLARLKSVIQPTRKTFKKPVDLNARFMAYQARFPRIDADMAPVSQMMMNYRLGRVQRLTQRIKESKLRHVSVNKTQKNTTCLFIRLYPSWGAKNADVSNGVTNTLIAVFSGVLQYKLREKNICLRSDRRQSFGFIRPTLTDAGCLIMRLSLGLEPSEFDEVVIESLKLFDGLLDTFNFQNNTHPQVMQVMQTKNKDPKKRGQYAHIRSAVASDARTLETFNQAQAYIDHYGKTNSLEYAVEMFLSDYILKKISLAQPKFYSSNSGIQNKPTQIIALLTNTLIYANKFAASLTFDADHTAIPSVFFHAFKKLFKNAHEGALLLNKAESLTADELFYQASRCVENLIEYLLFLDAVRNTERLKQDREYNPIATLKKTELTYCQKQLGLSNQPVQLFFADSGQQAINVPLMVYGHNYKIHTTDNSCIYLHGQPYFEISEFFHSVKKNNVPKLTDNKNRAKIIVVDITEIDTLDIKDFPDLKVCTIDITHHPDTQHALLKKTVHQLLLSNVTVVLSSSTLKHEQLGQDKFQGGKFFVISPLESEPLADDIKDHFQSISDTAMNASLASAYNLFNDIGAVKEKDSPPKINPNSFFATPQQAQSPLEKDLKPLIS